MRREQSKPIAEGISEATAAAWHVELCVRDLFAMAALAGLLARSARLAGDPIHAGRDFTENAAVDAWAFADAMMVARGRSRPRPGR